MGERVGGGPEALNPTTPPGVSKEERGIPGHPADQEPAETAEEAFASFLADRYTRLVATVRVIVNDQGIAEDLVQEAFAKAYLNWEKLWPEGNPGGWIHRVAVNLAISWRRRAVREVRAVARLGRRTEMSHPAPEAYPELHEAVARLPARQRTAVALYYVLGLPVDDAAKVMGCRPGTVKSLLFQARERLRERLGDEYG